MARKRDERRRGQAGADFVKITPNDLRVTARALTERLPVAIDEVPDEPATIDELMRSMPGSRTERLSRLAMAMSGSSERSSRAYRSARRSIERYVTTGAERRRPRESRLVQIARYVRRPHLNAKQALAVAMKASVIYVGQVKTMPAGGPQFIDARALGKVRDKLRNGDEPGAARALLDAWVYAYRLNTEPIAEGVIGSIEWITVELA